MPEEIEKPRFNALIDLISMFESETPNCKGLHVYHIRYAFLGENCGITDINTLEKVKIFFEKDINKELFDIWKKIHASYLAKVKEKGMSPSNLSNHLKKLDEKGYIDIDGKRPDNVCVKLGDQYYNYSLKKNWKSTIEHLDHTKMIDTLSLITKKEHLKNDYPKNWLLGGIPIAIVKNFSSEERKEFFEKIFSIQKNLSDILTIGKKKINVKNIYFYTRLTFSNSPSLSTQARSDASQ